MDSNPKQLEVFVQAVMSYLVPISFGIACFPSGEFVDFKGEVESLDSLQSSIEERLSALESENANLKSEIDELKTKNLQLFWVRVHIYLKTKRRSNIQYSLFKENYSL